MGGIAWTALSLNLAVTGLAVVVLTVGVLAHGAHGGLGGRVHVRDGR